MIKTLNLNTLVRKNVLAMKPYSSARDEFSQADTEMIFLDANENPNNGLYNRYPDPKQNDLKQFLSEKNSISTDHILLGNGSDEVLDLLFRAFCEPGTDNVITLPPTYGMYETLANINAVSNRKVLLNNYFMTDTAAILKQADENTKMILLCSPNNPTGNSFSEESITFLLSAFDGLVVIDEAYIDFSAKESWLCKLNLYPNLIVTQTLSKAYGLAGIRIGILYASAEIVAALNTIKPPYNISGASQAIALERVQETDRIAEEIATIIETRNALAAHLETIDFIEKVYPSDANFLLVKVDDATLRYNQLIENGIVLRNRTSEPLCKNCIRITIGTPDEMEKLLNILKTL